MHFHKKYFTAAQESRQASMKDQAMEETVSLALDVNGNRKYFQPRFNLVSGKDLLWKLHYHRSQSKFALVVARRESPRWVQTHPLEARSTAQGKPRHRQLAAVAGTSGHLRHRQAGLHHSSKIREPYG